MAKTTKRKNGEEMGHLHIRISETLKKKLALAAARDGMDLSAFARNSMIRRARELGIEI